MHSAHNVLVCTTKVLNFIKKKGQEWHDKIPTKLQTLYIRTSTQLYEKGDFEHRSSS